VGGTAAELTDDDLVPIAPDPKGERPRVSVDRELRRSRVLVLLRLPLAVPHILWAYLWTIAVVLLLPIAWCAALVLGRLPRPLHRFVGAYARYLTHLNAFIGLAANPFPGFTGTLPYPIDLHLPPPVRQPRLGILLRWLTVVPALAFGYVLNILWWVVVPAAWLFGLVTGRLPAGLQEILAYVVRFQALTMAYALLLTRRYPTFGGDG
jgi:hypothetical protein